MNVKRDWARKAPHFPVDGPYTLAQLVNDFTERRKDPESPLYRNRDDIVDACAAARSLSTAIVLATESVRPNGKVHNHQSRVPLAARRELADRLTRDIHWLKTRRVMGEQYAFERVLLRIEGYGLAGIGPVTMYDVCTRVCAWLGLEPSRVHMHAGCLAGAKALGLNVRDGDAVEPLRFGLVISGVLKPDEIEDFLCVYREALQAVHDRWVQRARQHHYGQPIGG